MRWTGARGLVVAAAAGMLLGGCGLTDPGENVVNGKTLFVQKCGSCHVLKRAGTTGVTGPNLDAAFERARFDGFGESTFQGMVHKQIVAPARTRQMDPKTGKLLPLMPPDIVKGDDAEDVAAYVASAVGKAGEDGGALAQVGAAKAKGTAKAKGNVLEIPADPGGSLAFVFAEAEAKAGRIQFRSPNDSSVDHNIAVEGNGLDEKGPVVKDGGVSELSLELQAGEYTFYCSVVGHRAAGMEGPLRVN
jgi:plastocyanin